MGEGVPEAKKLRVFVVFFVSLVVISLRCPVLFAKRWVRRVGLRRCGFVWFVCWVFPRLASFLCSGHDFFHFGLLAAV